MELKKDNTIRCNYTIPESIVNRLEEYSKKNNISKSRLIAVLLDKFLKENGVV